MPNGTGLAKAATTGNRHIGIKSVSVLGQLQRLPDNHSRYFPAEVFINGAAIDHDVAATCL